MKRRAWTPEETAQAIEMRRAGQTLRQIARALKRGPCGVDEKLRRVGLGPPPRGYSVPPEVLERREREALAPRTIHHMLLGDPLPGRSALDRKRGVSP